MPTRYEDNAGFEEVALQPAPPAVEASHFGRLMLMVWPKPTPSIGISTFCTRFERSYVNAKPVRMAVLRSPKSLPSMPFFWSGLHAMATRGEKAFHTVLKTGLPAWLTGTQPKVGL